MITSRWKRGFGRGLQDHSCLQKETSGPDKTIPNRSCFKDILSINALTGFGKTDIGNRYEHIPIIVKKVLARQTTEGRPAMEKGEKLVIIGRGGVGGPAAMLSRKLMPDVTVTLVSEEDRFIVR